MPMYHDEQNELEHRIQQDIEEYENQLESFRQFEGNPQIEFPKSKAGWSYG